MFRTFSLHAKVWMMVMASLAVLTVSFGIANEIVLREDGVLRAAERQESNMRVAWEVLDRLGPMRREGDALYAGSQQLNGFFGPVDRIKDLVGGTATIFMGDLRIATNVKKPDGSRAVGTKLAAGPAYTEVFAGKPYRGEADILGTIFFTAYDPIKDAAGKTIGVLYVGVPKADFFSSINSLQVRLGLLSILAAAILGMLVLWISKRMFAPLRDLTETVAEVADGKTDRTVVGTDRQDEIGRMAGSVEHLRHAMIEQKRLKSESAEAAAEREAGRRRQAETSANTAEAQAFFATEVEAGFERLANGDLTVRLEQPFATEYEGVRGLFNQSVARLEEAMAQVIRSTSALRTGLREIAVASGDLAQRTEQQAASLEETVAALGEVTSAVARTADGAANAQRAAVAAQTNAERGGEIVGRAVTAMAAIEQSSDKIGKIIGVIDEIAFQTNLLALNAGVEAARAGEAGRGFAVVAQEVRGLAQRSAEAAKEIKELISTSSAQVGEGVDLVTASGKSLEEIVTQVADMSVIVGKIASSAREQATSLKGVSAAADQMDKVTQQNAAMVEETTAAAQTLSTETAELAGLVGRFRTADGAAPHAASRPATGLPATGRPAAGRAVVQMRSTGRGGAAMKPETDGWSEF